MAQSSIPVVFSRKIIHPHLNSELHHFGVFNFLRWATVKIRGLKCFASRIFEKDLHDYRKVNVNVLCAQM